MLTPREATEAPTQRSRSPLSPTEVTELATVRLFLILSALLCSLRPGFCIVYDLAHARPIMLQHSTSTLYIRIHAWATVCQSQHRSNTLRFRKVLVNAEHYGRAGANPRVWENTTILSYIHVYYTIYNIRKTHCSVGITGYEYLHNYNHMLRSNQHSVHSRSTLFLPPTPYHNYCLTR